ncbi:MAG: YdeI/OmpD-associated family protein [Stenotrophomonas sp.]
MPHHDPRIDAYIAHAASFAQPLLRTIRQRVHQRCGEATEAIKWGMPAFLYRGKLLCTMAAFKQHAALGLWQRENVGNTPRSDDGMGQYGRLTGLQDLPDEREFAIRLAQGMQRIDAGTAVRKSTPRPVLEMPTDFAAALQAAPAAQATFDGFAPSYRRDYLEWILEAKRAATRQQRIAQSLLWLGEGKRRHWKHEAP